MPTTVSQAEVETQIRVAIEVEEWDEATTLILSSFGPEIVTYLLMHLSEQAAVTHAFHRWCGEVWRNLGSCPSEMTVRIWSYMTARQVAFMLPHGGWRTSSENGLKSELDVVSTLVLSRTLEYLAASSTSRGSILRNSLERADRELLLLRIDRKFDWPQTVQIMAGRVLRGTELAHEIATLKHKFDVMTATLRENAKRLGMSGNSST